MEAVTALIEQYFPSSGEQLCIGAVPISVLASTYGTPLFVYDQSVIERKWNWLREALPPRFAIYYSIKANPNQAILKYFIGKGAGLEIASGGEYYQAVSAGCEPGRVVFAGPGKTEAELELVASRGVGEVHVESIREARALDAICRRIGVRVRIAVRVNPGEGAEGGAMRMGGRSAPFGVDEEDLPEVLDALKSCTSLDLHGVHMFSGTQILDAVILANQYRNGLRIARQVAAHHGRPLHTIDFGGGLGIRYFPHEQELDLGKLKIALQDLVQVVQGDEFLSKAQLLVEPGRYLVGECGLYIARIIDIKISRRKKFLIIDGGMNHQLAASGNLGQTIKRNYPIAILNKISKPAEEVVDVVGPLCTPLDCLARNVTVPSAEVGDWIGVFQSGAYGRSASPLGFLSHQSPPEVWVESGRHRLVRRRGQVEDYLRDQVTEVEQNSSVY